MKAADLATIEPGPCIRLTGPVFVKGAARRHARKLNLPIYRAAHGFQRDRAGSRLSARCITEPSLVHLRIRRRLGHRPNTGVRIPGAPFMGVSAVAPSAAKLRRMDRARAAGNRQGQTCSPARSRRRGADRALRSRRPTYLAAA